MTKIRLEDESGDKKYFTIIPNYILNHSTLWDREVYIQMKRITGEDGTCWTSQKTLAEQCGISVNRLKKSLKYLIENKWIINIGVKKVKTSKGPQEVNEYKVADLWNKNNNFYQEKYKGVSPDDTPIARGVSPNKQRGITGEAEGVSPEGYKEEPIKEELSNKIATPSVAGGKYIDNLISLFEPVNPFYRQLLPNKTERGALGRLVALWGYEKTENIIKKLPEIISQPFAPRITTPYMLEVKAGDLMAFIAQKRSKTNVVRIAI